MKPPSITHFCCTKLQHHLGNVVYHFLKATVAVILGLKSMERRSTLRFRGVQRLSRPMLLHPQRPLHHQSSWNMSGSPALVWRQNFNSYPIGSMGLVYLPARIPSKSTIHAGKYTIHRSYGVHWNKQLSRAKKTSGVVGESWLGNFDLGSVTTLGLEQSRP